MSAKQVLGKDLMLFIGGKAIALATSCKLGLSAETIDTQSKDSGMWNEKSVKKLAWNCSSDNCFSADEKINGYDALFALFVAAEPIEIAFKQLVLYDSIFFKFGFGMEFCLFSTDFPRTN